MPPTHAKADKAHRDCKMGCILERIRSDLYVYSGLFGTPVTMVSAAMQENDETSRFRLCRLAENSTMESIQSPKPRTHCSLCRTTPLQKMSLPSIGLDLWKGPCLLVKKCALCIRLRLPNSVFFCEEDILAYLYARRRTKSSKKADSKSRSWSGWGRSENPGIFSAQPRMIPMEPVSRS